MWVLGFQGFATYPNFKVLGFQGLETIKILSSWVSRVSLHIKILRSWVSRVLRHNTVLRSWVSRVPRQKGRARSKIHQGPRPWTQRTQDLEPFWNLGTSLNTTVQGGYVSVGATGLHIRWHSPLTTSNRGTRRQLRPSSLAAIRSYPSGAPAQRPAEQRWTEQRW